MADLRESFPILENVSTQAGVAAGARVEGDSSAGIAGMIGFAFKDSSGNVVLPQLNTAGQLPVTMESVGNNLYARGENAGSGTEVAIATIALTPGATYEDVLMQVSCFRDTSFRLAWNNDGVETDLADALTGPGSLTFSGNLTPVEFTAGGTGTQELILYGTNQNALSTMRGTIAVKEIIA